MESKIKVHGKSQKRTVLGIVNAYMVIYPDTTADELRKAFPGALTKQYEKLDTVTDAKNHVHDGTGLFHEITEVNGKRVWKTDGEEVVKQAFHLSEPDETFHTSDGKELAMEGVWPEDSFNDMVKWAKKYGIEVASFEKSEGAGIKGGYTLEYLNGYTPTKKQGKWWLWLLIGIVIIALILFFVLRNS